MHNMSDEIERCILVKTEVFVYKIPPRASARGYRAADWNLSAPDWTGRLRLITGGKVNRFFSQTKIIGTNVVILINFMFIHLYNI
jgi:hypothetical protein